MLANLSISCLVLLAFALLASAAPTLPQVRVPYIRLDGYELEPTDFGYILRLTKPDGTSRKESFKEVAPGQLSVSGYYNEIYGNGKSEVNYKADKNGYVAKYHFDAATHEGPLIASHPAPAPEPAPAPVPDPYSGMLLKAMAG